ncbi:hypothetical protein [Methylopila sp. 73B]|uniref:hypothetical protein n=1 Tax=Methylopila sp. 73B TaxID=1120792 RepID=UPI0012DC7A32|nr:hypothetical protein [Methylopila sp. 73B]
MGRLLGHSGFLLACPSRPRLNILETSDYRGTYPIGADIVLGSGRAANIVGHLRQRRASSETRLPTLPKTNLRTALKQGARKAHRQLGRLPPRRSARHEATAPDSTKRGGYGLLNKPGATPN